MEDVQNSTLKTNFYLQKYGFINQQIVDFVSSDIGIIIVIPCFNEDDLISTLSSIANCDRPSCGVEVIVVFNSGESTPQHVVNQNKVAQDQMKEWKDSYSGAYKFYKINVPNLPKKHAGVGLARKIGMDEAVARFHSINKDGVIVCFDADARCSSNYLTEIEQHFKLFPESPGCSIHFEHPLFGSEFPQEVYDGIINYELHLRYYNQCLKYANLPYAYHTVGSSMAVKSKAYQKQGGMNKRKAGEDFYFIHKIIALGDFSEIKTTKVIPSPRISDRVPFGTGKAIGDWVTNGSDVYFSYNFSIFEEIKAFVNLIPLFYSNDIVSIELSNVFIDFLQSVHFKEKLQEIKKNTTDIDSFRKRFFVWFDAFQVLKLVHFMRDNGYPNKELIICSHEFLRANKESNAYHSVLELLQYFRLLEKS